MPLDKRANAEPVPGYRLLERLGAGGFGEVWKCEAPGGIFKAIKFVYGNLNSVDANTARAEDELKAVQRIKSIRHPFLLSIDRVESVDGELIIITELADQNLHELWQRYRGRGSAGVPRDELLAYLGEAAEVLDLLNHKFELQHLDVKPHNLFLVSGHVKVADFGLVNSLGGSDPDIQLGAVTPLYAAPELFGGKLSRHSDQYSLAIVFQELLTGTLPFQGKNVRQLLVQHTQGEPDLQALPEHDRPLVARALAKDPEKRYASCIEFIRTLRAATQATATPAAPLISPALPETTGAAETVTLGHDDLALRRGPASPTLPAGILAEQRFLARSSISQMMEVWKIEGSDGKTGIAQFLYGLGSDTRRLKDGLARLATVTHPALIIPSVAHIEPGRVVFTAEFTRETLRERFHQCQARKKPGIPRRELIDDLRAAAEVLDYLYHQHNIQHLNLSPRHLVLDGGWLRLTEFGYAQILWLPEGQDIAGRNARYAAPELFERTVSRGCDQFSLALIYAELLTGVHPFRGQSAGASIRRRIAPDLARLPELDRDVIARALHADPQRRWPSCTEMLLALEGPDAEMGTETPTRGDPFARLVESERTKPRRHIRTSTKVRELNQIIKELVQGCGGPENAGPIAPRLEPDAETLEYRFQVGLPLGSARVKLDEFGQQIFAQLVSEGDNCCTYQLNLPANLWQSWLGRQPALQIALRLARVNALSATPIEVTAQLKALNCHRNRALDLLREMGSDLLENLQKTLLVNSEKRMGDRLLWPYPLRVTPIGADGRHDEAIECRGKDISQTGIGFYLPHELSTSQVLIDLPNTLHPPTIPVPATLVRVKRCADGWYDVGAIFQLSSLRRSTAELSL